MRNRALCGTTPAIEVLLAVCIVAVLILDSTEAGNGNGNGNSNNGNNGNGNASVPTPAPSTATAFAAPYDLLLEKHLSFERQRHRWYEARRFRVPVRSNAYTARRIDTFLEGALPANSNLSEHFAMALTRTTEDFDGLTVRLGGTGTDIATLTAASTLRIATAATCGATVPVDLQHPIYNDDLPEGTLTLEFGPRASTSRLCARNGDVPEIGALLVVTDPWNLPHREQYYRIKRQRVLGPGLTYNMRTGAYSEPAGWTQFRPFYNYSRNGDFRPDITTFVTTSNASKMPTLLEAVLRGRDRHDYEGRNSVAPRLNNGFKAALCQLTDLGSYRAFVGRIGKGGFIDEKNGDKRFSTVDEMQAACDDSSLTDTNGKSGNKDYCYGYTTYTVELDNGERVERPLTRHRDTRATQAEEKYEFVSKETKGKKVGWYRNGKMMPEGEAITRDVIFYERPDPLKSTCSFNIYTKSATAEVLVQQTLLASGSVHVYVDGAHTASCGGRYPFAGDGRRDVLGEDNNCGVFKLCVRIPNLVRGQTIQVIPDGVLANSACDRAVGVLVNLTDVNVKHGSDPPPESPDDDDPSTPAPSTAAPPTTPAPPATPRPPTPAPLTPIPSTPAPTLPPPTPAPRTFTDSSSASMNVSASRGEASSTRSTAASATTSKPLPPSNTTSVSGVSRSESASRSRALSTSVSHKQSDSVTVTPPQTRSPSSSSSALLRRKRKRTRDVTGGWRTCGRQQIHRRGTRRNLDERRHPRSRLHKRTVHRFQG